MVALNRKLFCLLLQITMCFSERSGYTAAVVEYYPFQEWNISPEVRLMKNTEGFIEILDKIQEQLDIIVYPESVLHSGGYKNNHKDAILYATEIPDTTTGVSLCSPCENKKEADFLIKLACAAKKHKTYLVANVLEKSKCKSEQECAKDGWNIYNTNVVFDRMGAFVTKYRKFNLFGEFFLNKTVVADISIFETDFGIKFGLFTCFDILFKNPALRLIEEHNIKNFIFPSMWFSELPFLTALQAQHQWAHKLNVVLLASGANHPKRGSGGTGIYQGIHGSIIHDYISEGGSKAYIGYVSHHTPEPVHLVTDEIDKVATEMDNFQFVRDDLSAYTSKFILPDQQDYNESLCSGLDPTNQFCCNFNIKIKWLNELLNDGKNHYQYRMVAYSGVRTFTGMYNGGVEICGIVACLDKDISSCTLRFDNYQSVSWPATFTELSIKANYTIDDNKFQFPNSLLSNIRPLPVNAVEWLEKPFLDKSLVERTYKLKYDQNRLMTFAIYGRDINRDSAVSK